MNSKYKITKFTKGKLENIEDLISIEEPLEISLKFKDKEKWITKSLSITMRTPGHDEDLVRGFLFNEQIIQNIKDIKNFLNIHKDVITKPLYGNGGEGINRSNNSNLVGIETASEYLDMPIIAQKYIPEINKGDRRIIFFDGKYAGSVARIPIDGSIKANFHAGGIAKKTDLVFRDSEIIEKVGAELKELDLFFVGIDIIGNFLTEINVTSPTGIKQINQLNNVKLEQVFWDKLEAKYKIV